MSEATLRFVGHIRSELRATSDAPRQGSEGAPDAWLEIDPALASALAGVAAGDASSSSPGSTAPTATSCRSIRAATPEPAGRRVRDALAAPPEPAWPASRDRALDRGRAHCAWGRWRRSTARRSST
jgi:hypothetical protein